MKQGVASTTTAVGSSRPARAAALVAVADPSHGRALRRALEGRGLSVIAITGDGREALELTLHYRPNLVLLDFDLPKLEALAALDRLRREAPSVRVVLLAPEQDGSAGRVALRTGASGYLDHGTPPTSVAQASIDVLTGITAVSRALATEIIADWRDCQRPDGLGLRPVKSELTRREWEVLDLLSAGLSATEIAEAFVVSPDTIETHVKNLMRKLDVHSRAAAVVRAGEMRQPVSAAEELRLTVERRYGVDRRSGSERRFTGERSSP